MTDLTLDAGPAAVDNGRHLPSSPSTTGDPVHIVDRVRPSVGEPVAEVVPAAETEIYSADEGQPLVDDDQFLVVGPQQGQGGVVGVPDHADVGVAQALQTPLGVDALDAENSLHLLVQKDEDTDSGTGLSLKQMRIGLGLV